MLSAGKALLLTASLLGAVFSLLNAAGAELLCITEGCRIYSGYGLFGISFYALGSGAFLLIFLLGLLYPRPVASRLLPVILIGALLVDTLFLAWQTLFWPCLGCLTVALLLGLAAWGGRSLLAPNSRRLLLAVGLVWLLFFGAIGLAVGREIALPTWSIAGDSQAPMKVFFSPDCPACRRVVTELLQNREVVSRSAFFPIAKGKEDERRLAAFLVRHGDAGDPSALLDLFEEPPPDAPALPLRSRLGLFANKSALARMGATSVPLLIAPELPNRPGSQLNLSPFSAPLFTPEGDAGCPAFEEKECD